MLVTRDPQYLVLCYSLWKSKGTCFDVWTRTTCFSCPVVMPKRGSSSLFYFSWCLFATWKSLTGIQVQIQVFFWSLFPTWPPSKPNIVEYNMGHQVIKAYFLDSFAYKPYRYYVCQMFSSFQKKKLIKLFNESNKCCVWISLEHLWVLLPDAVIVLMAEFFVDWFKHAFVTKFNEISSDVSNYDIHSHMSFARCILYLYTYFSERKNIFHVLAVYAWIYL